DFSLVPKFVRANVPGKGVPLGRASGLLEVHLGLGMTAVTGNGLGGGSLVNAGVLVRPDADVLAQSAWPASIRHAQESELDACYARARAELDAHTWPGDQPLRKTV